MSDKKDDPKWVCKWCVHGSEKHDNDEQSCAQLLHSRVHLQNLGSTKGSTRNSSTTKC